MKETPYLFSMLNKEKLEEILTAFQACIGVSIRIIDQNGHELMTKGAMASFCREIRRYLPKGDTCEEVHRINSVRAVDFGGSYIFSCHAYLNHITYPLVHKGSFFGAVLVGPFLMETPDSSLILDVSKKYSRIPTDGLLDLYDTLSELPILSPSLVTQISRLLTYLFDSLITDSQLQLIANREKLEQQSKINESIQMYKTSGSPEENSYPFEKEKELLSKVKTGNVQEAKGILNDLLGYVLFSGGSNLDTIKSRSIEPCSLLSRSAIEGGAPTDRILRINNEFLKKLVGIGNIDELCYKLQDCVVAFTDSMFSCGERTENSEAVRKAMKYISRHYAEKLTLEAVANEVHLNPTYFSTVFKQTAGSSFKEYLTMVRIEESKRLLANTDYSVIDIAVATGFDDQGYFSKVFKRYTGLTPKQFR